MRPYDQRFTALLAHAARVFAGRGYDRTSMRDLAAASGMSLAGIYYYVRGKEDLLYHIQERCFTQVLDGAEATLAAAVDPEERLAAFMSGTCDKGLPDSRYRSFLAAKLLREHPVPHDEGGGTARAR